MIEETINFTAGVMFGFANIRLMRFIVDRILPKAPGTGVESQAPGSKRGFVLVATAKFIFLASMIYLATAVSQARPIFLLVGFASGSLLALWFLVRARLDA